MLEFVYKRIPDAYKRWFILFGGFLILFTSGFSISFGNISPYITSYMRAHEYPSINYTRTSLLIDACTIAISLSSILCGVLTDRLKLSLKTTTLIGCVIMDIGQVLLFFTIKGAFAFSMICYVLIGAGIGIAFLPPLSMAMNNSIILFGVGIGGICFIQIQTIFINPENLQPDEKVSDKERYFSKNQADLLNRVPYVFLLTTSVAAVLQLIGILCLFEKESDSSIDNRAIEGIEFEASSVNAVEEANNDSSIAKSKPEIKMNSLGVAYNISSEGMNFKDAMKNWNFWNLFMIYLFQSMTYSFLVQFYKTFGQTFIENDRMLAVAGSLMALFNSLGRILWGYLIDKLSFKTTMFFINAVAVAFIGSLYPISLTGKSVNDALFLIWISVIFIANACFHITVPTIVAKTFGLRNFTSIYGVILQTLIIESLLTYGLAQLLESLGYFWMLIIECIFCILSWILVALFNVKDSNRQLI